MEKTQKKLNIIPLGGLGEVGKNMTAFRYGNDIILIDAGLMFPEDDMLGIDLVIPDITYLVENQDKLKGIFLTHGHEDHIGALPYILRQLDVPVYGTALTLGILEGRLKEAGVSTASLNVIKSGDRVRAGSFKLEFMRVNHSIPDAIGMAIHTPVGLLIHTGDFKIDQTPVDGQVMELNRFAEYGDKGVLLLMADSTNAERPGYTQSEKFVGETFDNEFRYARNRIIVATFSSNVHRIQQIFDAAVKYKRKVAVMGRSMVNVVSISLEMGYLKVPDGGLIDIDEIRNYTNDKVVVVCTGSQGEPMSALTRMSMGDNRKVQIVPGDTVIISATPIPGNEKHVTRVVNELMRSGAEVIYEDVHVSGHACQEELKLIHALTKPKFFIPVHGEYKHLVKHAQIAYSMGMPESNVIIGSIGDVIETDGVSMKIVTQVPSGRVMVDGLGVGDVGSIVLRDRKHLAQDGLIIVVIGIERTANLIVSGPDIISRGFVYVRESEELMEEARQILLDTLQHCSAQELKEWGTLKNKLRDVLSDYIYGKTKRSPMILPIIMEV